MNASMSWAKFMINYKNIKLLIFDCDGVFTDGKIIYDNHRVEAKNFSAKDGLGVKLWRFSGGKIAMITGRDSQVVAQRCHDLKFDFVCQGVWNKRKSTEEIMLKLGYNWQNVAIMGDDWNDYPVIKKAALSAAPADSFPDFKKNVDYIASRCGGEGAVREFIELILKEQGRYDDVLKSFIDYLENTDY
jgi:3-deoxy-D-manno-octulosonate 8-phosphate phosphatase (KDO 8-P phosphatase)